MISDLTLHQIRVQRYAGRVYRDLIPILDDIREEVQRKLMTASTEFQQQRLTLLLLDIDAIISQGTAKYQASLMSHMYDFAELEQTFALSLLDRETVASVVIGAGLEPERLRVLVDNMSVSFANGEKFTINQLIDTYTDSMQKQVKTALQTGIIEGKTLEQTAREVNRIQKTRTRQQSEAVVRTVTNMLGTQSRQRAFSDYQDLYRGEEFVAVLDARTTPVCFTNDGKIFPFGKGLIPPLHYSCRSVRVPKLKPEYDLNIDSTRAAMDGEVSAKLTYSGWLRSQSKAVQNEVLGIERAKLFRSGKMTLDKFVDSTGELLTLKELRAREGLI